MKIIKVRQLAALSLVFTCSPLLAGPPLTFDDPGILDPGQWEFIAATTATSTTAGDYYQIPQLSLSLGVFENFMQIGAGYSYAEATPNDGPTARDHGNFSVGAKWRFLDNGKTQLAFAPYYSFGVTQSTAAKGIGNENDILGLPVNIAYQVSDKWRLNSEVRYVHRSLDYNNWGYGASAAYVMNERHELLFALSGSTGRQFKNASLDARLGLDAAVTDSFHVLFSIATGLKHPSSSNEMHRDIYLGFKLLR